MTGSNRKSLGWVLVGLALGLAVGASWASSGIIDIGQSNLVLSGSAFPLGSEGQIFYRTDLQQLYVKRSGSWTAIGQVPPGDYAYIVCVEAGSAKKINGKTGEIEWSSSDHDAVINAALGNLTAGRSYIEWVLLLGSLIIDANISMPDYSGLLGGKLFQADNANTVMITNLDWASGNNHIVLENLYLDGNGDHQTSWGPNWAIGYPGMRAIFFENVDNLKLIRVETYNCRNLAVRIGNGSYPGEENYGIGCTNVLVDSCYFDTQGNGAAFWHSQYVTVTGTTVKGSTHTTGNGLDFNNCTGVIADHNHLLDLNNTGIVLWQCENSSAFGNDIKGTRKGIAVISGSPQDNIKDNTITGGHRGLDSYGFGYGIAVYYGDTEGCHRPQVSGNTVTDFDGVGIYILQSNWGIYSENIIYRNGKEGILLEKSRYNQIGPANQILDNSWGNIGVYSAINITDAGSAPYSAFNRVQGNTVTSTTAVYSHKYAVNIENGADNNIIADNTFTYTNQSVPVYIEDVYAASNTVILDNEGYNPRGFVAGAWDNTNNLIVDGGKNNAPSNNTIYTCCFSPKMVYVKGTGVTEIYVNAQQVMTSGNKVVPLYPGDTFRLIWTTEPTVTVMAQ